MSQTPLYPLVKEVRQVLATTSGTEKETNLWVNLLDSEKFSEKIVTSDFLEPNWNSPEGVYKRQQFFAASLPSNTTTGVIRQHTLQLNSSINCENQPQSAFPRPCPGENPFYTRYTGSYQSQHVEICSPGDDTYPWSLSRDAETITEELWISVQFPSKKGKNLNLRCQVQTTRGYFELGNAFNNNEFQPLLATWPTPEEMEDFDDFESHQKNKHSLATVPMTSK
jgi:hypothetical protein